MKGGKKTYHHGNLAESLLEAVDEIAGKFGLEAVTLRACAKLIGVSPSSAFRHYADKRDLMTAFAARALEQLAETMGQAQSTADEAGEDEFKAVGLAYVAFAIDQTALFRAMWREETIYSADERYRAAANRLSGFLKSGFASTIEDDDPDSFSAQEVLAWSAVHGLASLMVDGPVGIDKTRNEKLAIASDMLEVMSPSMKSTNSGAS